MKKNSVLIIDDEKNLIEILKIGIKNSGYDVYTAYDPETGLKIFKEESIDIVISDIRMHKMSGLQLLLASKKIKPDTIFILMTAYSSVESVIEALRGGASDYLVKPFEIEELIFRMENALKKRNLQKQVKSLTDEKLNELNIVGKSEEIRKVKELIERVSQLNTNILIIGESGSGKELVAKSIHYLSNRPGMFIPVNCASIPENLLESELFGFKKGAFTSAVADKDGVFKLADEGTLFLDEITELPLQLQPKLLRVIETLEYLPLGATKTEKVNVRIIAATNRKIEKELKDKRFRDDLYYRLNVVSIIIPPLRERKEDIPILTNHFLIEISKRLGLQKKEIDKKGLKLLCKYDWPGNVRELENLVERIIVLEKEDLITEDTIKKYLLFKSETKSYKLKEIEMETILKTLEETKGDKIKASKILGIHPSTLYRKLKTN